MLAQLGEWLGGSFTPQTYAIFVLTQFGDSTGGRLSMGPHLSPTLNTDGGNLGSFTAGEDGLVNLDITDSLLLSGPDSIIGRAIVCYELNGNSRAHVVSGVVGIASCVN